MNWRSMKKWGILVVLWLLYTPLAHAQAFMTTPEKLAFSDVSNAKYITARNKAEALLAENKDAIGATYVMALVYWEGEGNLLRSLSFLKKAIKLYEEKYCAPQTGIPKNTEDQMWHLRMLRELARIYSDLDDRQAEIDVRTRIATLYNTSLGIDSVWALMKLDRFDEATQIARQTIENSNQEEYWLDTAYNDLTAIADAQHKHTESFKQSLKAVDYTSGRSCVILLNHSRALAVMLKFDEALDFLQKAQRAKDKDCVSSPYEEIAQIYLLDTQWQKAISSMLKSRKRITEPRLYEQTESKTRSNTADIYYAMGFAQKAWDLTVTVIDAPQRLGFDSLLKEQLHLSQRIVFLAISNDYIKRLDEQMSAWNTKSAFYRFAPLRSFDIFNLSNSEDVRTVDKLIEKRNLVWRKRWSTHQEIFKDALSVKNIRSLLVPMYILSPQYFFAVVDALGRKTSSFLIDFQEQIIEPEEISNMKPMFELVRAYIAYRDADDDKAIEHIEAYQKLAIPRIKLLDAQIELMQADIAMRNGDSTKAYDLMTKVYSHVPSLFRQFDVPIPFSFDANIDTSDDDIDTLVKIIRNSPRFVETPQAPFVIAISKTNNTAQICLNSNMGTRYACSSTNENDYDVPATQPIPTPLIADNFYHVAFAPKVDLSQADLHSLDGSPVQVTADQALEKLMKTSDARIGKHDDDD